MQSVERGAAERELLQSLLELYAGEAGLYREVLVLARRQLAAIRTGTPLSQVRDLLAAKSERLDAIARLELEQAGARTLWETRRDRWSGPAVARVHDALREVGGLIEEILVVEEQCDRLLLADAGVRA